MKKFLIIFLISFGLNTVAFSGMGTPCNSPVLNKILFQISAEKWASTQTAKVTVNINATLTDKQLGSIHNTVMDGLNQIIPKTDWHITQFNRNKNDSGLEQLSIMAEARVAGDVLANVQNNAKSISKPGITYTINAIDFSPSLAEIQKIEASLRAQIYVEIKEELSKLDKEYPSENFFLHNIQFNTDAIIPQPQLQATMFIASKAAAKNNDMTVSNKVILHANVVLAASQNNAVSN